MFKNTKYVHFWEPTQPCEGLDGDWHIFSGKGMESAAGNASSAAQCSAHTQHRQGTKNAMKSKMHTLSNFIFPTNNFNSKQ